MNNKTEVINNHVISFSFNQLPFVKGIHTKDMLSEESIKQGYCLLSDGQIALDDCAQLYWIYKHIFLDLSKLSIEVLDTEYQRITETFGENITVEEIFKMEFRNSLQLMHKICISYELKSREMRTPKKSFLKRIK